MLYPRMGFKGNFNRKGGGYNDRQPTEGLRGVALFYMDDCPERLAAGGVFSGSW